MPDALRLWLSRHIDLNAFAVDPIVPEASTRRFWRLACPTSTLICIFSPPETENNQQFSRLSDVFLRANVPVSDVLAEDLSRGFFIVSDLGKDDLEKVYGSPQRKEAIEDAMIALLRIQQIQDEVIPIYTRERLVQELKIFDEWLCHRLIDVDTTELDRLTTHLIDGIDDQPKLTIHRDFHCRNLLWNEKSGLGIVDFQDALVGSCCYDIASWVYDCYYQFKPQEINDYLSRYFQLAKEFSIKTLQSFQAFVAGVEFCAIQRQLKAVGIFVRLMYLQGKKTHLPYVLPVLSRVANMCARSVETEELGAWLDNNVLPQVVDKLPSLQDNQSGG